MDKKYSLQKSILPLMAVMLFSWVMRGQEASLPGGEIEVQVCDGNPSQSYAIYLPPSYSPEKNWPILYAFDPGARGKIPVERFLEGARQLGYIVAGSNNSRNGPYETSIQAMNAMWEDTHRRFSIDDRRIYLAGFSGGARAVSLIAKLKTGAFAGVMLCGAGLAHDVNIEELKSLAVLGIAGDRDSNLLELAALEARFDLSQANFRMILFQGTHLWPPPEDCTRALEWMHIRGMAAGIVEKNEKLIERLWKKEWESGRELEERNDLPEAYSFYRSLALTFKELRKVDDAKNLQKKISSGKEFQEQIREVETLQALERQMFLKRGEIFARIEQGEADDFRALDIIRELKIDSMLKQSARKENGRKALMAYRILSGICMDCGYFGRRAMEMEELKRALLYFGIGIDAARFDNRIQSGFYYSAACACAAMKDKKRAIKYIRDAVAAGFDNAEALKSETYLSSIRDREEFQQILSSLKEKKK